MVYEILLALFAVIGLAACVRFVMGLLLYPVRESLILLPARGDGQDLEHQLKALRALEDDGKLAQTQIYLADFGLSDTGLATAENLCRRYPEVHYCILQEEESV